MSEEINNSTYEGYHQNGQLWIKCTRKDGDFDGLYEEYYDSGRLRVKCTYKNGALEGLCEEYHENGKLCRKCTYKNGKKDGPYERYYKNGQLAVKCAYKDGKLDGLYEKYYEDGILCKKCIYKNGKEVPEEKYNHLTQNGSAQIIEAQTDKKATSEVISDKSDENSRPRKSRAEKRVRLMELQESARFAARELSMTTDIRHALAVALNNLRYEFGCTAKKVAAHSKTIKALREKEANHR
ncbi:MAG: toxin-antitoxin system YwqK family antitoxin [Alphaproteobacteria bacterium]|nr:toxin-antitoxin system YwqK family antitoxin [Alphaproteobacteria bacterium]